MIDHIKPAIFKGQSNIFACFTKANRTYYYDRSIIPGLNLGLNTNESKDVIEQNFKRLASFFNINRKSIALAGQVHGTNIQTIVKPGVYDKTDGLVTNQKKLFLGIQVADCAAVLIADSINHVAGAFHAGWRGTVNEIVPKGITSMIKEGAKPECCSVYISPCISMKSFEVGKEVAELFPTEFCDYSSFNKPHVDLKSYIIRQLTESGVPHNHIESSDACTVLNDDFFSFRREREQAGRMLALVGLT